MSVKVADNIECWSLMVFDCNSFPTWGKMMILLEFD